MTPGEVVRRWFDAWEAGGPDAAREVAIPDVVLHATAPPALAGDHVGWDAFVGWYARRRDLEPDFTWRVDDVLGGERHAAAVLQLGGAARPRMQVALYRVEGDRIADMWFHEPG